MSTENLKSFYQFIGEHSEIRLQLDALPDQASFVEHMVQLGTKNGFNFTAHELEMAIAGVQIPMEDSLLSDDQLSAVAGGAKRSGSIGADGSSCEFSKWLDPFCT